MSKSFVFLGLCLPAFVYASAQTPLVSVTSIKILPAHTYVTESYELSYDLRNNSNEKTTVTISGNGLQAFSQPCKLAPAGEAGSECVIKAVVKIDKAGNTSITPQLSYLGRTVELSSQSTQAQVANVSLYAGGLKGFSYSTNGGETWQTKKAQQMGLQTSSLFTRNIIRTNTGNILAATSGGLARYDSNKWSTLYPDDYFTDIEQGGGKVLALSRRAFFISQDDAASFKRHTFSVPGFNDKTQFVGQLAAVSKSGRTMAYEMRNAFTGEDVLALSSDQGSHFKYVDLPANLGRISSLAITDKAIYFLARAEQEFVKGVFSQNGTITWKMATLSDLGYPTADPQTDGFPYISDLKILNDNLAALSVSGAGANGQEGGLEFLNSALAVTDAEKSYGQVDRISVASSGTGWQVAAITAKLIFDQVDNRGLLSLSLDSTGKIKPSSVTFAPRSDLGLERSEILSSVFMRNDEVGVSHIIALGDNGTLIYTQSHEGGLDYKHLSQTGIAFAYAASQLENNTLWFATSKGVSRVNFANEIPLVQNFDATTPNFPQYAAIDNINLSPDNKTLVLMGSDGENGFSVGSTDNLDGFITHHLDCLYNGNIAQDGQGHIYIANYNNYQYSTNNGATFNTLLLAKDDFGTPFNDLMLDITIDAHGNFAGGSWGGLWVKNLNQPAQPIGIKQFEAKWRLPPNEVVSLPYSVARQGKLIAYSYRGRASSDRNLAFITQNTDGTVPDSPVPLIYSQTGLGFNSNARFTYTRMASNGVSLTGVSPTRREVGISGGFVVRNSTGTMFIVKPADVGIKAENSGASAVAIKDFPGSGQCVALVEFESASADAVSPDNFAIGKSSHDCQDDPHRWIWTVANEKTIGFSQTPEAGLRYTFYAGQIDTLDIIGPNTFMFPTIGGLSVTYDGGRGFVTYNAKTPGFMPSNLVDASAGKVNED